MKLGKGLIDADVAVKKPERLKSPLPVARHMRFALDPRLAGYQLGKTTPEGIEVFDDEGSMVGYYNK